MLSGSQDIFNLVAHGMDEKYEQRQLHMKMAGICHNLDFPFVYFGN